MSTHANVYEAVAAAMLDIGGVKKDRRNEAQRFLYRGIADVTLAVQPALAKHGLCIAPYEIHSEEWKEGTTKSGGVMMHCRQRIEFRCYHASGTWLPVMVTGEAMDTGDKTANKVMAVALKYCLTQLFCIPEEDPELDTDAHSPGEQLAAKGAPPRDPKAAPAGARSAGPAVSSAAPAPEAFPKLTLAQAKHLDEVVRGILPDSLPAARLEWISWAVGRKVERLSELNTAEGTIAQTKARDGEMPTPVERAAR